jgi:hypothetical protein
MTKPFKTALVTSAVSISIILFIIGIKKKETDLPFSYTVFRTGNGWGYNIILRNKVFIHQENMPAIESQAAFSKEIYAEKTALLILTKLRAGKLPSVSSFEVKQILQSN